MYHDRTVPDMGLSVGLTLSPDKLKRLASGNIMAQSTVESLPLHRVRSFLPPHLQPVVGVTPLKPGAESHLPLSRMNSVVASRIGKATFDPAAASESMEVAKHEATWFYNDDYWWHVEQVRRARSWGSVFTGKDTQFQLCCSATYSSYFSSS